MSARRHRLTNAAWLVGDEDGRHAHQSSTLACCDERYTVCGHWFARKGTSIMCDCHQRLRLPQSCYKKDTVAGLQIAVIGVRRRYLYGNTRHSVLSVTVQVAGPGGGRGGVGE